MKIFMVFLAILGAGTTASAQEGMVFSLGGSSLGATVEAGYRIGPNFGLRGIAGYASADFSSDYSGAPLTGNATIGGFGLLADLYIGSGARLTAGAIAPNYSVDLNITGDITVNGNTANNVDIIGSVGTIKQIAPVFAVGYEKTFANNWGVSADFGAMYTGGFLLTATDNSGQIPQVDLDAELADINAEIGQISILPFIKLGVSFAF